MPTHEWTGSRVKAGLGFMGSLIFVVIGLLMISDATSVSIGGWLSTIFFGACLFVFLVLCLRPFRLAADQSGLHRTGGLRLSRKTVPWNTVDSFFIYNAGRWAETVGYNYRTGFEPPGMLRKLNRVLGADSTLPALWRQHPTEIADVLNEHLTFQRIGQADQATTPAEMH